ncbi:MAG TPA: MFS transporter, partial [Atribacterota bacterium]|nr:MFS transporter [Atribacterota bacterium]
MENTLNNSPESKKNTARDYNLIRILIALFLPYLALSVAQNGFLGLLPFIRDEFDLSRVQVGYYSTFFFISASFLSVFSGNIVDSFGPKKSILLGIGSLGILLSLQGLSSLYSVILILSFLSGLGFSIITPSATKAVMLATPREKRAFSMGFTQSGFGMGGILGASILPFLGEKMGWRAAVQIAAGAVLLTGLWVYKLYHDNENDKNTIHKPEDKKSKKDTFREHLSFIIADKLLFRICFSGMLFGISEGALLAHFVVFLTDDLMISKVAAGLNFAALHLGGMAGLLGWGFFSDRFFRIDRRFGIFLIGLSSGFIYLFFGLFVCRPFLNQILVFFLS